MSGFNPYSIVPFVTSIATGTLGLFCFWKNHSSRVHQLFCLVCLSVVPWPFAVSVMLNLSDPHQVVWWTKAGHLTCTIAPALFLDFVVTLTHAKRWRKLVRWGYTYAAVMITGMLSTDLYFPPGDIYRYWWGPYAKGGILAGLDALFGCFAVFVAFSLLFGKLRETRNCGQRAEYNRLRYIGLSFGIFSFALLDYLPKYGIPMPPIGSFFLLGFAGLATYAIIKHQILDFTLAIRRTAIYSILAALITASYLVMVLVMERLFQGFMGYRSIVGNVIAGFVIALGFSPVRNAVQAFVDRCFFRGSQEELAEQNEQLRREVQRTERLKAVSTLAAGMAHEIKNPLSSIKTFAQYLPEKYDDPAFREKFAKILGQEVDRMNHLVQRLLDFARPTPPELQQVRLSQLVNETLEFLHGTFLNKQIRIETSFDPMDEVGADPGQLKQALLNVLLNSVEAMPGPGRIAVSTVRENGSLAIVVADTGPGIPRRELQHVFDPFYTTKPHGTGLGLSVVHTILREHGGRVTVESEIGKGTTVTMQLPIGGTQDTRLRTQGGNGKELPVD